MAMEAQTPHSPPFSTAGLGPCELSCSHSIHSNWSWLDYHQWVFWSTCGTDEVHCVRSHLGATAGGTLIKNKIKCCLQLLRILPWMPFIVQFWGLVKDGDKMYLTACDQPFALWYSCCYPDLVKRLCEYRKHCLKYLIRTVDDDEISVDGAQQLIGGPPGRVFRSGLPECARDVRDYTSTEYPLRDCAVGCVGEYWVLPVYHHPTQHLPSGVLEIASSSGSYYSGFAWNAFEETLRDALREANLTIPGVSRAEVSSCQDGEIDKIDDALSEVGEIHKLDDTTIWTTSEEILSSRNGKDFIRKGQGVVGKAFSSKSACFCRDIRLLSITEYPLAPKARYYRDSACFAVCLQSSCSNNCIYVLEFFLPTNEKDLGDPRTLLNMLMETLKQHLQSSFRIAPGQGLGEKLTVEVIKVSPKDEFDCFEICSTTSIESTPRLGEVQGGEAMMQPGFSSQQVDAANGSTNCTHEQQNASVGSTPGLANTQGGEGMTQVYFSSQQVAANAYTNGAPRQQSGIVGSTPRSEHVQGFVNISSQELMAEQLYASNLAGVDAANNSINSIYEQQNGTIGSSPRREIVQNIENIAHDEPSTEINVANPERGGASIEQSGNEVTNIKKRKSICTLQHYPEITREVLEQNSSRNLKDSAKVLKVSRSTLKRICREYGIPRWPPRRPRKVNQVFVAKRVVQPSTENIEEHHRPDTTRAEDDCSIWVKAKYQGHTMKFRLPLSARKVNLEEEVAQRLNRSIGSFKIEYLDEEDDWIWIACDKDLSTCMSTLSSLGRKTIEMKVEGSHIREP